MKFIVLGGGLTGLSCALTLNRNGHEVVVLEKESEVGGLTRCVRMDGFTFDIGPHFLFGKKTVLALNELVGDSLDLKPLDSFRGKMYFRKRYFNFPFQPKDFLTNIERTKLPGICFDLAIRGIRGVNSDSVDCVEDWVINSVGKRIYDYTQLSNYISKLYGISPRQVSKDWGVQKLKFLRNMNPFKLGISTVAGPKKERFINYPPSGIDAICKQMAKSFTELGGKIIVSARAQSVSSEREGEVVVEYIAGEARSSLNGDFLVSTIPVDELARMVTPAPGKEVLEAVAALKYRFLITLFLCVNKKQVKEHGCIYFSEKRFPFKRITEFTNLSEKMAPKDKTSLCVEITCFENDEIMRKDDAAIYDLVLTPLEHEGFLQRGEVEQYKVLRIPNAYPVYDLPYYKNLETIFDSLSSLNRVVSIGRQGLFSYNTMGNSIRMGLKVGKELSASGPAGWSQVIQARYNRRLEKYYQALHHADLRLDDVH